MNLSLRVFLSSTFSDFDRERRAIQEIALPKLREDFAEMGVRYELIDLRWGITEQAQETNDTMQICLKEIRRCQKHALRPNFALLLGNRYGWQPLPSLIPSNHWKKLMVFSNKAEKKIIRSRYRGPDRNIVPYVYRLDSFDDGQKFAEDHNKLLQNTLRAVAEKAGFTDRDRLPYFASATHQEIAIGAFDTDLCLNPEQHVFAYIRNLNTDLAQANLRHFVDSTLR